MGRPVAQSREMRTVSSTRVIAEARQAIGGGAVARPVFDRILAIERVRHRGIPGPGQRGLRRQAVSRIPQFGAEQMRRPPRSRA